MYACTMDVAVAATKNIPRIPPVGATSSEQVVGIDIIELENEWRR